MSCRKTRRSVLLTTGLVLTGAFGGCSTGAPPDRQTSQRAVPPPTTQKPHNDRNPGDLYVIDIESRHIQRLTKDPRIDGAPSWSPDGQSIVFGRLEAGEDPVSGNSDIHIIRADGSNDRNVTDDPATDQNGRYLPDGRRIVFSSNRSGNADIYLAMLDGTAVQRLTDDPGEDRFPEPSGDGHIVFVSDRGGDSDLYVMAIDGSAVTRLTSDPGLEMLPAVSPDGHTIAFTTETNISLMDTSGTNRRVLAKAGNHPSWSPDGTSIAAVTKSPDGDFAIAIIDATTGTVTALTDDEADDFYPSWSPNGATIAFTSVGRIS